MKKNYFANLFVKELRKIFGNYFFIIVRSFKDYENIEDHLNKSNNQDICIVQYEEDWFIKLDWGVVRNTIKNHPNWTKNSFLITNSHQDFLETKKYIKCIWRPAIVDLIVYKNREKSEFTVDGINKHTGLLLTRTTPQRKKCLRYLLNHHKKLSILKYGKKVFVSGNTQAPLTTKSKVYTGSPGDFDILLDGTWINNSAFILVMETHYRSSLFAPTLSEKTFRSMYFYRPALIFGGQGVRTDLLRLGFDTWDWFIDWSYDDISDDEIRFDKFLEELNRLMNIDINEMINLIESNKHHLIHNRNQIDYLIKNYDKFYD